MDIPHSKHIPHWEQSHPHQPTTTNNHTHNNKKKETSHHVHSHQHSGSDSFFNRVFGHHSSDSSRGK